MPDPFEGNVNVLVIDDDADVRERLSKILCRRGYAVLTACDGLEGLAQVRNNDVDIILCDIAMPKMDGLEFLKNVHYLNLKAEVIMVTGESSVDKCLESIERNACAYLVKPVTVDVILENLAKAVRRIREKKEMLKTAFAVVKSEKPHFKLGM